MILVAAVGKVHANDVQPGITELVDGLNGVGLGANRANDGRPAEVALGLVGGVELGKPVDPATEVKMVQSGSGHYRGGRVWMSLLGGNFACRVGRSFRYAGGSFEV